jgi:Retron-type reverse transcriptase
LPTNAYMRNRAIWQQVQMGKPLTKWAWTELNNW